MMEYSWEETVEQYVAYRRNLGFDLSIDAITLLHFARFAEQAEIRGYLTVELCISWAKASKKQSSITWERRIGVLRGFAKYLKRVDPRTEIPPLGLFGAGRRRPVPHIFTEAELQRLLEASLQLVPCGGLRPATCRAVFGLLSATGLRIGEALALTSADIDFESHVLTIRGAKRHRPRLIPVHPTVSLELKAYAAFRDRLIPTPHSQSFFLLENGRPATKRGILYALRALCRQLGWQPRGDYPHHRVHDLRHTFIVRTALHAHQNSADVHKQILALSAYVGHVKVADTYWYFTGIPELMSCAAERFHLYAQGGME